MAAAAYLHGLDHVFIPSIGDEPLYLQIARATRSSGRLLPLVSDTGITDTKPPLLFWQGIAAATLGGFELAALRLPNVLLTFLTAALAGWLAARIAGRRSAGLVAALAFLGFRSTLQHGRPFLTNAGETLFLFLPLVLLRGRSRPAPWLALACGASLGVAALYKSFAVVVPGTLALALVLQRRARDGSGTFARRWGPLLAAVVAVALAVFALWPALDPRPDLVLSQFVLGENAGKFRLAGFLAGLWSGPWPLWRIWLAPLLNAGLLAPVVLALALELWRRRRSLSDDEAELWRYVLAFLLFYSLPTQRQENYLLPTCPVIAVLLALRWDALRAGWFRIALILLAFAAAALPLVERAVERAAGAALWSPLAWVAPALLALAAAAGALHDRLGRALLPILSVCALVAVTSFLEPFSRPLPPAIAAELRGAEVWFPDRFQREHELYRFMSPGAVVRGYACPSSASECLPPADLPPGALAAVIGSAPRAPPGFALVAAVPHLRQRHSAAEVAAMAGGDLQPLLGWLVVARKPAG